MEVGDAFRGSLDRVAQRRRNGFARGAKVGNRNPEVVEDDPVEPLGQLPQRGIATLLDGGEDLPHRRHGSVGR